MSIRSEIPSGSVLAAELGPAKALWDEIITAVSGRFGPIDQEWKPSKSSFGSMCLLKRKKRTLLYMIPETGTFLVAIVLGERAVALVMDGDFPETIKTMFREARKYAEGRGIRFYVRENSDIAVVAELIAIKLTPR